MKDRVEFSSSRRRMLKMLSVGTAGLALAACAPRATSTAEPTENVQSGASGASLEQGELSVLLCCATEQSRDLQERFSRDFEATYPGVKVKVEQPPPGTNYFEKLQTLVAAGTPPDVFDMWEGYVAPYAQNGVLKDLTPYIDADPEWKMDDFQPAAVAATSWQNRLYALVRDFYPGPSLFFYNKDIFDAAGLEYPNADWTWDKMKETAKALTKDAKGTGKIDQWGVTYETWFVPWLYWIWSNGGDVFNADETKCTIAEPPATQAIQYWADLALKDNCAIPSTELAALQGAANAFITGAVGMYLGYTWNIADMKAARDQGLNWSTCLPPKANNGGRVFYMHLECWALANQTKMPKASWQYIRDYTVKAIDEFVTLYPGIPLLKDKIDLFLTPEHKEYGWDKIPEIVSDPKNIRIPGAGAKWDKIAGLIQSELDLVVIGEKTAEQAMNTAAPLVDQELARSASALENWSSRV